MTYKELLARAAEKRAGRRHLPKGTPLDQGHLDKLTFLTGEYGFDWWPEPEVEDLLDRLRANQPWYKGDEELILS